MIGKNILHYKILEKLGEGGMGVVYKAEDTKLERTVALKFLSLASIGDEEKKRFKREAKAAAALNHANIAHIYAIDESDGQIFIAMEIVGAHGGVPLRIDDAIDYATQIAAGLQAAHEKGIVHRDIKSANIMITEKGQVKIMDFGLAKLTKGSKMTQLGTTLGTIAYMSPEQAQGEKVDHRSDIWSLGVVLYEMISGQMPFKGDYEQAVIYSIQNEEPEPLTAVRTGVPMDLEKTVNKLLAKDPRDRYQNIMELPVDLKNVSLQDTTTSRIGSSVTTDTITREKQLNVQVKYSYKTILTIAATALVTFLLTWIFRIGHPPGSEPGHPNKMAISLPENHSLFFSEWNRMAISPDGRHIVYLGNRHDGGIGLFLKRADEFDVTELDAAVQARAPFFSTDGRWVGYVNQQTQKIFKISVDGGEPLKVASDVPRWASATWTPDNTIIYGGDILKRVPDSAGEPVILTKKKHQGEKHLFPHMLPDGKTVLFTVGEPFADLNGYRLALYRLGEEDSQIILDEEGYNAVYSTTGHILYGRSNRLMAVPFDLESLRITGLPSPVLDNVQTRDSGSMSYALSAEGTLIFAPGATTENDLRSIVTVDLSGQASDFFEMKKEFEYARYSPNGQFVAFIIDDDDAENIWIYDIEGRAMNQLTFYNKDGPRFFAWSPESKFLAYATTAEDSTNSIYVKKIDGTGLAHKIYTSPLSGTIDIHDWSEDGDKLSFDQDSDDTSWDLFVYSFQDSSADLYLSTPGFEVEAQFSRNWEWLAYMSNESGTDGVYVRPYPKSRGGVWKISNGGGTQPVWSADGDKIYYRGTEGDGIYSVAVTATEAFSKRNPEKVFDDNYWFPTGRRWDIHPNGDRLLMIQRPEVTAEEQKIFVIQNFDEELKRLAPVE